MFNKDRLCSAFGSNPYETFRLSFEDWSRDAHVRAAAKDLKWVDDLAKHNAMLDQIDNLMRQVGKRSKGTALRVAGTFGSDQSAFPL